MSDGAGDDRGLMPRIGDLPSARAALALARLSNQKGTDGELPDIEEDELLGVVVALSNLSAMLARVVIRQRQRATGAEQIPTDTDADTLLAAFLHDQEMRAARDELAEIDEGFPWLQ